VPPLRVLVIEDNAGDVRLVTELLRDERHAFEIASRDTLGRGIAALGDTAVDLVLLDLGLPDSQGLATFQRLQEHAPHVPVVVLTGSDDQDAALRAIQEGAQDYLVKGQVDADRLGRAIRYGIERKKSEEAQRLAFERLGEIESLKVQNQLKLRLISEATHELNTPLTPLKIQLHLLRSGDLGALNGPQEKAVAILERNLDRLRALLSDLLDVARLQNGRLVVQRVEADLAAVAREVADTFLPAAGQAGIRLEVATQAARVLGDPHRLTQVVVNFVSNALKFTPPGGRVRIEASSSGREAVLRVSDTGCGLTAEQRSRLFAPFSQVHDRLRQPVAGTGLGLYICKGIAEGHGGRAWVESPGPGKGSTFCLAVPLAGATPPLPSQPVPLPDALPTSPAASEVLVA
jgi:signal transduction histidine kinase